MNEIEQTLFALNEFAKAKKQDNLQHRDKILEKQKFLRQRAIKAHRSLILQDTSF